MQNTDHFFSTPSRFFNTILMKLKHSIETKYLTVIFCLIIVSGFSGCTTMRALMVMNAQEAVMAGAQESEVSFIDMDAHVVIIPVRINNSEKIYRFMLDTGALTILSRKTADDFGLEDGVEITARDSEGGEKKIKLVNLPSIRVGDFEVSDCAAGIIDMEQSALGMLEIDGILGSNYLKFFKVTIDYQKEILHLSKDTGESPPAEGVYQAPFTAAMEYGYAPVIECKVDDAIEVSGVIDTGAYIVSLPLELADQTKAFKNDQVVKARGAVFEGAFKASEGGYLLRLSSLEIGSYALKDIPVMTSPNPDVLIGYKFLSRFAVTLNFPAGIMTLKPYDNLQFEDNIFSFGAVVRKEQDGKVFVKALWEGVSAEKAGVRVGDEIVSVNGTAVNKLTPIEIENIYNNDAIKSIDVVIADNGTKRTVTVEKEWLLPPSQ